MHDLLARRIALSRAASSLRRPPRAHFLVKRAIDVGLCVLLMVLLLPVVLAAALVIKLHDGGPVIYAQTRTGRNGMMFRMYKLRTMCADADARVSELREPTIAEWFSFKSEHDPRVTPIGRLLRSMYLDELPQLVNVLRGEMSLVGPRPYSLPSRSFELWQTERFEATPGVTCLWQATHHRDAVPFDERLRLDIRYMQTRSITGDLKIMADTLRNALRGNGR